MRHPGTNRRGFLNFLTSLLLAGIGLIIAIPAIRYLLAPLWKKGGKLDLVDVGSVADLPVGEWRLLTLETVQKDGWRMTRTSHAVWVRRQKEGDKELTVLSSICPHLGCPINWHPQQSEFVCPCHGGKFDVAGEKTGGPPPRAMDPLDWEVRADRLLVRWQDFKIGVSKPIAVNV
jgi:Rieske Fe-S protein